MIALWIDPIMKYRSVWVFVIWLSQMSVALRSQTFSIDQHVIPNGGGTSGGGIFSVSGAIGQLDAGSKMIGGEFVLLGGFWIENDDLNIPPTISVIADQTIDEDQATDFLRFNVADVESPSSRLIVTARSSNTALVPDANISLGGSTSNRSIIVQPAPDAYGQTQIGLTVSDGVFSSDSVFLLTVLPVNDAPTMAPIDEVYFFEDAGELVFEYNVIDIDSPLTLVSVNLSSDNEVLFPPGSIFSTGINSFRSMHILPAQDQSGIANITATVSDGIAFTMHQFRVNVAGVDDPPVLSNIVNATLPEDGSETIGFVVSDPDTSLGELQVNATSSHPNLVNDTGLVLAGTGSQRTLTIYPVENQHGNADIRVTVTDGTSVTEVTFVLTVTAENDPPNITGPVHQTMDEDAVASVDFQVSDLESAANLLTVSVVSNSPTLFPDSGLSLEGDSADRRLLLSPVANGFGEALITLNVSDGELEASTSFQVTVSAVNDLPVISPVEPVSLNEDGSAQFEFRVSDLETANDQLEVSLISLNEALFSTTKIGLTQSADAHIVTLTPEANQFGDGMITIRASDGEGVQETEFSVEVVPVPDPPAIDGVSEVRFNEDLETSVQLDISDIDTPDAELITSFQIDNPLLFSADDLNFVADNGASGSIILKPLQNAFGHAILSIEVSDGERTTRKEISVTVVPVNDPPLIQAKPNQFFSSGGREATVPLVITDAEHPVDELEVTATIDSGEFVVPGSLQLQLIDGQWNIKLTPRDGQAGVTRIYVNAFDGIESSSIYFIANFNVGNAPPVMTLPERLTFDEDQSITVFIPIVDDLLGTEELELSVSSSVSSLLSVDDFSINPVEGGAVLSLLSRPDQNGIASVTVTVSDTLHVISGIIPVEVNPIDDPPKIAPLTDRTVVGDQSFEVEVQLSDVDSPLTELRLLLESNFEELILVNKEPVEVTGSQTLLTFTPRAGMFGIAEVTVRIQTASGLNTEERFQVQVTDPVREHTPPVDLRLKRRPDGVPETLSLSWIGVMDVYVADQILGPYRLLEGVTSPFTPPIEPNGHFYKLVPRPNP